MDDISQMSREELEAEVRHLRETVKRMHLKEFLLREADKIPETETFASSEKLHSLMVLAFFDKGTIEGGLNSG